MKIVLAALLAASCGFAQPAVPSGPAVGEKIPAFSASDQNGRVQTLESLRGPNGLVLEFVRSADW